MDVFGATPATAALFEAEFTFELAGHHKAGSSRLSNVRLGNSFAETHVHVQAPLSIMRSILSMPPRFDSVKPSQPSSKGSNCGALFTIDDQVGPNMWEVTPVGRNIQWYVR